MEKILTQIDNCELKKLKYDLEHTTLRDLFNTLENISTAGNCYMYNPQEVSTPYNEEFIQKNIKLYRFLYQIPPIKRNGKKYVSNIIVKILKYLNINYSYKVIAYTKNNKRTTKGIYIITGNQ